MSSVLPNCSEMDELTDMEQLLFEEELQPKSWSLLYMSVLTMGMGGLQLVFALQFSYTSAYLTSLGISKPLLGVVWTAGPLSGMIIQPLVGEYSDRCQHSWGRRRPFIAAGGGLLIISLLGLGWTDELVRFLLGPLTGNTAAVPFQSIVSWVAVFQFVLLNIAIQPVQVGVRALIADSCPRHQQGAATAWAAIFTSIGNVLGFFAGFMDLPNHLPMLGDSQFKVLCVLISIVLALTLATSCCFVQESRLRSHCGERPFAGLFDTFTSFRRLSPQLKQICKVQFFAWMGWCPFLFYMAIYIAGIYDDEKLVHQAPTDRKTISVEASRVSSFAFLMYAIVSCISGLVLPRIIRPSKSSAEQACQRRPFRQSSLSLKMLWQVSQLFYAICILSILCVTTVSAATVLISFIGLSWAVNIWVPYALIGLEVSRQRTLAIDTLLPIVGPPNLTHGNGVWKGNELEQTQVGTGAIFGAHNMAIALPQVLATIGASGLFLVFGNDGLRWAIAAGSVAAIAGATTCTGINDV